MELDVMNSESSASASAPVAHQSNGRAAPTAATRARPSAAAAVAPLLHALFGNRLPVRFEFWDGSALGPRDGPGTVIVRSPTAVKRMLWAPGELGLGRAYVTGELDAEGDVISVLRALHDAAPNDLRTGARMPFAAIRAATRLGVIGAPPARPGGGSRSAREAPFQAA